MAKEKKKETIESNEPKATSENEVVGKKTGDVLTLKKELELKALARAEKAGKVKWLNAEPKIKKKLTEHTAYKNKDRIKS